MTDYDSSLSIPYVPPTHKQTKQKLKNPSHTPPTPNKKYTEDYDSKLGDTSFRLVNNQDIVARVPRATRSPSLIECV